MRPLREARRTSTTSCATLWRLTTTTATTDASTGRPAPNDTVFGRYNYSNRYRAIPGYLGGLADGTSTSAWGDQTLLAHSAVLGWTHILNQSMVNEFRFGWTRNFSYAAQQPFGLSQFAGDFVPGIPKDPAIGGGVPLTTFSNFAFEGSPDFLPKQQIPDAVPIQRHVLHDAGNTLAQVRRQHLRADAQPLPGRARYAWRSDLHRRLHLPAQRTRSVCLRHRLFLRRRSARSHAVHPAHQCPLRRSASLDGLWLCRG